QVGHAQTVLLVALEFLDATAYAGPSAVLGCQVVKVVSRVGVQQRQTCAGIEGQDVFVLRVDGSQRRRELPQQRDRGGLMVEEAPPLASGCNLAFDDNLRALRLNAVFFQQARQRLFVHFKDPAHHGFFRAVTNHVGGRFLTQQERKRVNQ